MSPQKRQRQQRENKQPVRHQHQLPEHPRPSREGALVEGIDLFFSSDNGKRVERHDSLFALTYGATNKPRDGPPGAVHKDKNMAPVEHTTIETPSERPAWGGWCCTAGNLRRYRHGGRGDRSAEGIYHVRNRGHRTSYSRQKQPPSRGAEDGYLRGLDCLSSAGTIGLNRSIDTASDTRQPLAVEVATSPQPEKAYVTHLFL